MLKIKFLAICDFRVCSDFNCNISQNLSDLQVTQYNPVQNQPTITVDIQNISATNTYCAISTVRAKYPSVLTDYGMEDLDISKKIEI